MSKEMKKDGELDKGDFDRFEKIVVAVKAAKEIPKTALLWALTHVVQPGDCITLIVVSSNNSGKKFWVLPRFGGDCANGNKRSFIGTRAEQKSDIADYCSNMILQLHDAFDPNKINVKLKVVSGTPCGAVAAEAKKKKATWVVLDRRLKDEKKRCMEELQCNIVSMNRSLPKVLRLNLVASSKEPEILNSYSDQSCKKLENRNDSLNSICCPAVTPSSSPETFTATDVGTSSVSSSDPGTSPFFVSEKKNGLKKVELLATKKEKDLDASSSDTDYDNLLSSSSLRLEPWMEDIVKAHCKPLEYRGESLGRFDYHFQNPTANVMLKKHSIHKKETGYESPSYHLNPDFSGNLREVISLRTIANVPPPLCSVCQHKAPVFGKPPRWFTFTELEFATGNFSRANFLAEGGYGSVHRGVLPDGQAIAVKQHKLASSQGDQEFCSEVEVLSCAQHRNVVMLIGFCIEDGRRLLVYEYICNGSLDSHLYGHHQEVLPWSARRKVAVGAARGLRYLHEECRVGCIVHRDMRPNNILLTHDFEPLVGDFGLARWQPDGEKGVETRVIGTFGYLAPEYTQSGQITEKADAYSFGVVLVELVTGRKAVDLNRPKGQQCLAEWARPLLEAYALDELVDPRLENRYAEHEVHCMLHAASLCLRRDPQTRPRMSQVIRILEGDAIDSSGPISAAGLDVGSQSGRIWSESWNRHEQHEIETSFDFNPRFSLDSRISLGEGNISKTLYRV